MPQAVWAWNPGAEVTREGGTAAGLHAPGHPLRLLHRESRGLASPRFKGTTVEFWLSVAPESSSVSG